MKGCYCFMFLVYDFRMGMVDVCSSIYAILLCIGLQVERALGYSEHNGL